MVARAAAAGANPCVRQRVRDERTEVERERAREQSGAEEKGTTGAEGASGQAKRGAMDGSKGLARHEGTHAESLA